MIDIKIRIEPVLKYVGFRVKHDAEMPLAWRVEKYGTGLRNGMPEVYILSESSVELDEAKQRLIKSMNPRMTNAKHRVLLDYMRAFTNKTGFGGEEADPPLPPRWDYVNNLDAGAELPAFDKIRICGGAFVTGQVDGNELVIDTLNPSTVPTAAWLLEHPQYYFHAVNTNAGGISKFPQGDGEPVLIPLFSRFEARLPLEQVVAMGAPVFLNFTPQ